MNNLECKVTSTKEEACKWVNTYKRLIDLAAITYDTISNEYVIFYYWKPKDG